MITAKGCINSDDCFLAWVMPCVKDCLGFALYKEVTTAGGKKIPFFALKNYTGFKGEKTRSDESRPCTEWPFQRYTWTDHSINEGDVVSYRIVPVIRRDGALVPDEAGGTMVGPLRAVSSGSGSTKAYFNRGLLLSQFMANRLPPDWKKKDLEALKKELEKDEDSMRKFLMGQLGTQLYALMDRALAEDWHVYAMLYELTDDPLIEKLKALGNRAHLVLAPGSTRKKGEDNNKEAADQLEGSIDLSRRMLWSEGLAHNKFLVFSKGPDDPFLVWTGSLNWATTGLCTQLNNGIMIDDPDVASVYREQWQLLRDDYRKGRGNKDMHFGQALMESNNAPKIGSGPAGDWTVWFSRTDEEKDLLALQELIDGANDAILFVLFAPGSKGVLKMIKDRMNRAGKSIYVQGVVNSLQASATDDGTDVNVDLVSPGREEGGFRLNVVEPEGVGGGITGWATEVMRKDFLKPYGAIGFAITHSKMIVIDPYTNPVVITGSHNMSKSASIANDENLIIIKGDKDLAERYAVNIMGTYEHFVWRAAVKEAKKANEPVESNVLADTDAWQKAKLKSGAEKLAFWTGTAE
jgi:hypothetical protein